MAALIIIIAVVVIILLTLVLTTGGQKNTPPKRAESEYDCYPQEKRYEAEVYEENIRCEKPEPGLSAYDRSNGLVGLTWNQLKQYQPVMDSKTSADYLAEHLLDERKCFTVKKSQLKKWGADLAKYKVSEGKMEQTADNNNKGIAYEKEGDIPSAISMYEQNLDIGYPATHSYDRLMALYRKSGEKEKEKRVINIAVQVFSGIDEAKVKELKKRLSKLEGNYIRPEAVFPRKATVYHSESKPLGVLYEEVKLRFKEFDFYNSGEHRSLSFLNDSNRHEIWNIHNKFKNMILDAREREEQGRLDLASVLYEKIVFEQFYLAPPYDKLIKIYSRAKLVDEEKRVLEISIRHFTNLRDKQIKYVLTLAQKYNKYDFAKERVDNGKKISYYGGAFELYNPYPIIQKWQERLNKLNDESTI